MATRDRPHTASADTRRTLAYFIVRRPRGLVSAALQYGHIHTKVTLNYAGEADTSWLTELTVERLEMVVEQADADWTLLVEGERVSGPAADEYRARITRARGFRGRVMDTAWGAQALLDAVDPVVHHGEG